MRRYLQWAGRLMQLYIQTFIRTRDTILYV
nr:MAG TPA: hypothetical protein [Caudoviricetes sp.]